MGKKSKVKGDSFERLLAKKITNWSNIQMRRTPQSGARPGEVFSGDINSINGEFFKFHVEVKKREGWNLECLFNKNNPIINSWWEQCLGDCYKYKSKYPLLIFSKNRAKVFCLLQKEDFIIINNNNVYQFLEFVNNNNYYIICNFDDFIKYINYNLIPNKK